MKYTMEKTIEDKICDIENAREFLNIVSEKFKSYEDGELVQQIEIHESGVRRGVFESLPPQFYFLRTSYNAQ
ncbi:hypothetical protein CR513_23244, partial [Mucuna pruriens]